MIIIIIIMIIIILIILIIIIFIIYIVVTGRDHCRGGIWLAGMIMLFTFPIKFMHIMFYV
jgi:hypothetical protein